MANILVERMLTLIHAEYSRVITLRVLGRSLGRQPAYLGSLFHNETGMMVRDYVLGIRMEQAEKLVREGVKIEAIALSVGYRSKKNFYRQFRRRFGTTPDRYRQRSANVG